jgi:small subunit ribosomal protein S6
MAKPNEAGSKYVYEVCVIIDGTLDDKKAATLLDKYLEVITSEGGTVETTDVWGRRKLAYPIQKKTEGIYIIANFTATSATTDEFARKLGLDEEVLRYKVFRSDI